MFQLYLSNLLVSISTFQLTEPLATGTPNRNLTATRFLLNDHTCFGMVFDDVQEKGGRDYGVLERRGMVVAIPSQYVVSVFSVISRLYLISTGGPSQHHLHQQYYGTGPGFYVCSLISQLFNPAHLTSL